MKRFGYCCVGVSEGLKNAQGQLMAEAGTKDAFGHAQLGGVGPLIAKIVKDRLNQKYHWAVADYLQRAARHLASRTDLEQSYAVGKAAVQMALKGRNAVMPAITRVSDKPYRWKITEAPLTRVANVEKMLPRDFITKDGFGITDKARRYLAPLIRGEAPPPFKDGLAAVRAAEERRGAEEARRRVQDLDRSSRDGGSSVRWAKDTGPTASAATDDCMIKAPARRSSSLRPRRSALTKPL